MYKSDVICPTVYYIYDNRGYTVEYEWCFFFLCVFARTITAVNCFLIDFIAKQAITY